MNWTKEIPTQSGYHLFARSRWRKPVLWRVVAPIAGDIMQVDQLDSKIATLDITRFTGYWLGPFPEVPQE